MFGFLGEYVCCNDFRTLPESGLAKSQAEGMPKKARELAGVRLNPTASPDEPGFTGVCPMAGS
jgi:hypothetical protein